MRRGGGGRAGEGGREGEGGGVEESLLVSLGEKESCLSSGHTSYGVLIECSHSKHFNSQVWSLNVQCTCKCGLRDHYFGQYSTCIYMCSIHCVFMSSSYVNAPTLGQFLVRGQFQVWS